MTENKEYKTYLPVDPDYIDTIRETGAESHELLIHYFGTGNQVLEVRGQFRGLQRNMAGEEIVLLGNAYQVRIDRIIAVGGKPGPAYDEYDSYALACLDCMGGMD